MKFSPHAEKLFKEFFTTNKKEKIINEIELSIANMENDLLNFLKSDYSLLIDECSWLEEIKDKIAEIRLVNLDVNKIAYGLNQGFIQNQQEITELDNYKEKIETCQREMKKIESFLELYLKVKSGIEKFEGMKKKLSSENQNRQSLNDILTENPKETDSSIEINKNSSFINEHDDKNKLEADKDLISQSDTNLTSKSKNENTQNIDNKAVGISELESISNSNKRKNFTSSVSKDTSFSNYSKFSLSKIIEFHSSKESTSIFFSMKDDKNYYHLTMKLNKMKILIESICKYFFSNSFKKGFESLIKRFENLLLSEIEELIFLDWTSIGSSIKLSKNISMFDEISSLEFLPKKDRISIFCLLELGLISNATNFINGMRKKNFKLIRNNKISKMSNLIETNNDKDLIMKSFEDIYNFYIGTILLSYILSSKFPNIYTFYNDIFHELPNLKIYSVSSVSKLRILIKKLKLDSYIFDNIIENIVFNYLNDQLKHPDILKYDKKKMFENIQSCINFINEINMYSGEFDELFVRRLDNSFVFILNNTPIETFFSRVDEIKEFNNTLLKDRIFKNAKFDYFDETDRSIEKLADREVENVIVFSLKHSTEDIVKRLIQIDQIQSQEFKTKFVKIFEQKAKQIYSNRSEDDQALIIDTARRNLLK